MTGVPKHSNRRVEVAIQHAESYIAQHADDVAPGVGSMEVGIMRTLIDALMRTDVPPTPPADDAREALAERAWSDYQVEHGYSTWNTVPDVGADFMAGFERGYEVRPRGTVTDAEVEAGARALYAADPILYALPEWREKIGTPKPWSVLNEGTRDVYRKRARSVLEAAREGETFADVPGGCLNCSSSGVVEDFDGDLPCSACDGTGTPRRRLSTGERAAINGALAEGLPIWLSAPEVGHARKALLDGLVAALEAAK